MKLFIKIFALVVFLTAGAWITPPKVSAQETTVSFQLFYDQLSPYGMWVDYQNYGYVWVPDVDREFSPYGTDGHWVYTDDGWTWVSNYSWGWAPFHYGRWAYDDSYGWLWVPHNEWGPAWVTWRRSEGYYGWAPMGPGISIELSFGGGYRVPNERWIFVSDRYINSPDINRYYVDRSTNVTIINNSTVITNTYIDNSRHTTYVAGPGRDDVQKVTGAAIKPVVIRENDKPGQLLTNDQLQIYRPRVQTSNTNDRKPAPSKIVSLKEVKPVSERKQGNQRPNENLPAVSKEQSSQSPNVRKNDNKGSDPKPQVVTPPEENKSKGQSSQPPNVKQSDNKGRGQQPRVVIPPDKNKSNEQPSQSVNAIPPVNKAAGEQPRVVNPPDKNKSVEKPSGTRDVSRTDIKGKEKQPQKGTPSIKKVKTQPKPTQDKKDKKEPKDEKKPGR